jgi:hypothetical protein
MPTRPIFIMDPIVILRIVVTTEFIELQTDEVIALQVYGCWTGHGDCSSGDADQKRW